MSDQNRPCFLDSLIHEVLGDEADAFTEGLDAADLANMFAPSIRLDMSIVDATGIVNRRPDGP